MKELVKHIAVQICHIDKETLSKCEANIARMLEDEGIIKEKTTDETVYVMVD